ncbi:MAG: sigma-70 family RNA polymerase sigma factor [Bacteroidales bacterium]|nr:sigma-70 family RNA polymerase sigma factor [Bacteroidales bacterium]
MDYLEILWSDFKKGNNSTFEKIYQKYIDILFRYGSKITYDKNIVKDSIQQLFLELYSSRNNLDNPKNLEFYLLKALKRIIIHRINNDLKQGGLFWGGDFDFNLEFDFANEQSTNDFQESKIQLLNVALQSLPPNKKELLFLKFYSGLKNDQIASLVDMNPATVQKQIYRILKQLQVNFKDQFIGLLFLYFLK